MVARRRGIAAAGAGAGRRGRGLFPGAERCVRTEWSDGTIGFFLAAFRRRR